VLKGIVVPMSVSHMNGIAAAFSILSVRQKMTRNMLKNLFSRSFMQYCPKVTKVFDVPNSEQCVMLFSNS